MPPGRLRSVPGSSNPVITGAAKIVSRPRDLLIRSDVRSVTPATGDGPARRAASSSAQHFLYLRPLPRGQGSFPCVRLHALPLSGQCRSNHANEQVRAGEISEGRHLSPLLNSFIGGHECPGLTACLDRGRGRNISLGWFRRCEIRDPDSRRRTRRSLSRAAYSVPQG